MYNKLINFTFVQFNSASVFLEKTKRAAIFERVSGLLKAPVDSEVGDQVKRKWLSGALNPHKEPKRIKDRCNDVSYLG